MMSYKFKLFVNFTWSYNCLVRINISYLIPDGKVKLANIVEGDVKAHFTIATTPRCREKRDSFPRIAPLYPYNPEY